MLTMSLPRAVQLMRASSPDDAILCAVWQSQLAEKAVAVNREAPHAIRHSARDLAARRGATAAEDAHLLFLSIHDLPRVQGQAVACVRARDAIDDDLVIAGRRTHHALRRTTPDADGIRRGRLLRKRAAREQARGDERDERDDTRGRPDSRVARRTMWEAHGVNIFDHSGHIRMTYPVGEVA